MSENQEIVSNLKGWREQKGKSAGQIAADIGITAEHYELLEGGYYNPSPIMLKRVAMVMNE